MYNILGALIYEQIAPHNKNINIKIDNDFNGLLFLTVQLADKILTHKIIKY